MSPHSRPQPIAVTQSITTTNDLFVCRVDVAGAAAGASNTRALTALGFALLVASRWLHLAGYALAFGACAFWWLTRPAAPLPRQLVNIGIALLVLAEPLALLAQMAGAPFDLTAVLDVLGSGYGLVLAQRLGAALLLWTLLGASGNVVLPLSAALGAVLALLNGAANPAAGNGWPGALLAALDQMALGLLVGGAAALGFVWRRREAAPPPARFRPMALGCLAVLAASALAMAGLRGASPVTPFGLALLAKLGALLVAALLAGVALRLERLALWRTAMVAGGGALAVAGLLASLP